VIAEKLAFQPSDLPSDAPQSSGGSLLVSGYLRARALRAGLLVHVAGLGDCQLAQIDGPEDPCPIGHHRNRTGGAMEVETEGGGARVLAVAGPNDFEPLIRENEPDPTAGEQTWPTEEELASAEEERRLRMAAKKHKKKVAKGTSEYQVGYTN
jgi:pre-rRNA-processing protein TSR1